MSVMNRLVSIALSLALAIESAAIAQVAAQGTSLAQADAQVREGHYPEALAAALEAIQQEPHNFKAYYYAAFSLYKQGRLDEAAPYAKKSLDRAPDESKAEVQRLVDAIAGFRTREQYVQQATEAEQNGFIANAADIYARAWKAAPDQSQDLGLKAAHIWVERIPQPLPAAEILNYIVAHPRQPAYLEDAQALLQTLQGPLRNVYDTDFGRGVSLQSQGNPEGALAAFAEASQAEPQERAPHYMMAKSYMVLNRPDDAIKEVLIISRMGGDLNEMMESNIWQESLYPLGVDSRYAGAIRGAFGPALLTQAQQLEAARQTREQSAAQAAEQLSAEKQRAKEQLPQTVGRLRTLLSAKFIEWDDSPGHSDFEKVHFERNVLSAQGCSISYHEKVKWYSTRDVAVTLNFNGLKASSTFDQNAWGCFHKHLSILNGGTGTNVIGVCFSDGKGYGGAAGLDEAVELLNQAALACSTP